MILIISFSDTKNAFIGGVLAIFGAFIIYINREKLLSGKGEYTGGTQEMGAQEFEGRWLGYGDDKTGIDVDGIRKKIKAMGATRVHKNRKYRRYAYNLAGQASDGEPLKDDEGNPIGARRFSRVREEYDADD